MTKVWLGASKGVTISEGDTKRQWRMSGAMGGGGGSASGASEAAGTPATGPGGPHHESQCCAINFRVRCEDARHGESVFLYQNDFTTGSAKVRVVSALFPFVFVRMPLTLVPPPNYVTFFSRGKNGTLSLSQPRQTHEQIPLYTTPKSYPWYTTRTPVTVPLSTSRTSISYRYAVYRAGVFHRAEDDAPSLHSVPLSLLQAGELYTVSDILGTFTDHPDVDHIRLRRSHGGSAANLARRSSFGSYGINASQSGASLGSIPAKKKVGFASDARGARSGAGGGPAARQAVNLTSSDGLIVVSAFLPVHLNRSEAGEWSADWDYEALLSMQTHLRVTRVGTVKWRGWHGNVGGGESSESGVPVEERGRVEAALRPFNCVPVWVPTKLFGEM